MNTATKTESQADRILAYMQTHKTGISPIEALHHFHCMRLAARISDLKKRGYIIRSEMTTRNGSTYCTYFLVDDEEVRQ